VGTDFSLHLHDRRKKFQSLAAGRSLLSTYAPPSPDVPPANIQLMARTRDGPGLFMRCEQVWAGIVPPVVVSAHSSQLGSMVTKVGNVYLLSLSPLCLCVSPFCTQRRRGRRGAEDAEGMHMHKSRLCRNCCARSPCAYYTSWPSPRSGSPVAAVKRPRPLKKRLCCRLGRAAVVQYP
jgi:hypothetical protein